MTHEAKYIVLAHDAREAGLLVLGHDGFFKKFTPGTVTIEMTDGPPVGNYSEFEITVRG